MLWLLRWRVACPIPNIPKVVAVVAPHTCGCDVIIGLATILALGIRVRVLVKRQTLRWPLGRIGAWLGGIPVDRDAPEGVVVQAVDAFRNSDRLYLALAPEGTRRKVERWKTGLHRIAHDCFHMFFFLSKCIRVGWIIASRADSIVKPVLENNLLLVGDKLT